MNSIETLNNDMDIPMTAGFMIRECFQSKFMRFVRYDESGPIRDFRSPE
jgi:hypothetical protein